MKKTFKFATVLWACAALVILIFVAIGITQHKSDSREYNTSAEAIPSSGTTTPVEEEEVIGLDTNVDVLIDYTDMHKFLFDYDVADLTIDELTYIINLSFESLSCVDRVSTDVVEDFILDVKANADDGRVYIVTHAEEGLGIIDVCSYHDRINPLLRITLTKDGESWLINKE